MAITTTFGQVETRMRRDLLGDKTPGAYGYSTAAILSRVNETVVEIISKLNAWAGYNQDNGTRISCIHTHAIETECTPLTPQTAELLDSDTAKVQQLRELIIPIDDRYVEAVAYLASAKILEAEGLNEVVSAKIKMYTEKGMELAMR